MTENQNLVGWDETFISRISESGSVPMDIEAGTASGERIVEESLWKAMSAQQKIGFFWKDKNRRFLGANEAFLRYYGLTLHDIIGKNDEDMHWHPDPEPRGTMEICRTGSWVGSRYMATAWPAS